MARIEKTAFISYRRTSFPWALAIYQSLTHRGFDVFFDYNGLASGDFETAILDNIRARAHFLIVLTPNSLDRCVHPDDWLRREMEEAMTCRRNIVPLFMEGFDFSAPAIASKLTGRLDALRYYNGVSFPAEYFDPAMDRLCSKFLNVPLDAVLHPASDLAREVAKEQQLAAFTDPVSGLPNRREFESRVERAIKEAKAKYLSFAVLYIDLDHFGLINDSCGRQAGDALLVQISELLNRSVRARDTVSRLDDDAFGVLLEGALLDEAITSAEGLRRAVEAHPFAWGGRSFPLGASIGVAAISDQTESVGEVLWTAETACRVAIKGGRNRVKYYSEGDIEPSRSRREMQCAARITTALSDGRFELHRIPIQPLQGQEEGRYFELLVRMRDDQGVLTDPELFIAAAERYGLISNIDRWVVEHAFRWLLSEANERERLALCSINLSGASLVDNEFLPFVIRQVQQSGLDASKICFEITETAAIASFAQASRFINALTELGCKFTVEDVGTGLSSFAYLKHFPLDYLKIDGSFVKEMLNDPIDREMVRSLSEIGHLTGKKVIAECAENQEIITMLRGMGVDYAQGVGVAQPQRVV